jgi:Cytochrome P460
VSAAAVIRNDIDTNLSTQQLQKRKIPMHHAAARVLGYCGALGCCAAVATFTVHVARSAAQSTEAGRAQTTAIASSNDVSPLFGIAIPAGYRDWRLVSVAREKGNLNDIRAVLGNDLAIKAYRERTASFPDGAIIARIAWTYVPSKDNDKALGKPQSFVAGSAADLPDWYLEFMVKDSKKYSATGGWGYAQFDKNGKTADEALMKACAPCHQAGNEIAHAHDFVFTRYAP